MKYVFLLLPLCYCSQPIVSISPNSTSLEAEAKTGQLVLKKIADTTSWPYFLQHLPEKKAPILDYTGQKISSQSKHYAIINYDVGNRDLQQCADALMRLRAEYLFVQNRIDEIGFHFVSGQYYSFMDYCKGIKPMPKGSSVVFISSAAKDKTHQNLRLYLDLVYMYASTISLARELKTTTSFGIGTIIIHAGSPGHCFIIVDEAKDADGKKLYKLVEGYTPAQSIYVLQNTTEPELGYWHRLEKGPIETASYVFDDYELRKFE